MFKKFNIVAFTAGLSALLFFPTPLGRVAILELVSYVFAIIIIMRGGIKDFNITQKRIILFGFLWLFSTILTDLIREEPLQISLKANLIVLSVPCVLIVSFKILKWKEFPLLWFMVGYGISGILSFYIFHNGAYLYYAHGAPEFTFYDITRYLAPDQYEPFYADGITYVLLFPLSVFFGLPMLLITILFSVGATEMILVGSRYKYLIYSLTALLSFLFLLPKKFYSNIIKHSFLALIFVLPIVYMIFEIYAKTASEGVLGEHERKLYQEQVVYSEYGAVGGRASSVETAIYAISHPILGTGSSGINQEAIHERVSGHSILFGTWAMNGLGALIFWLYACYILISYAKKFYLIDKKWLPFIMFMLFEAFWHILFSPFGYFRGFLCVVIAYSVIELTKLNKLAANKYLTIK